MRDTFYFMRTCLFAHIQFVQAEYSSRRQSLEETEIEKKTPNAGREFMNRRKQEIRRSGLTQAYRTQRLIQLMENNPHQNILTGLDERKSNAMPQSIGKMGFCVYVAFFPFFSVFFFLARQVFLRDVCIISRFLEVCAQLNSNVLFFSSGFVLYEHVSMDKSEVAYRHEVKMA